jgi:undecaprenyl diphosphate synthase
VNAAADVGLAWLTAFAFSTENWSRGRSEVRSILGIIHFSMSYRAAGLHRKGIRVRWSGSPDGLPRALVRALNRAQSLTENNLGMTFTICVNHGGRRQIVDAARALSERVRLGEISVTDITEDMVSCAMPWPEMPNLDVVVRTSGEQRVSNFLLWRLGGARLVFVDRMWPEFGYKDFHEVLASRAVWTGAGTPDVNSP